MFGYDFEADLKGLVARINRQAPADSRLLAKPTMRLDHEGGLRTVCWHRGTPLVSL